MKAQSALMAAAIILAPAIASAQPAQTPPDQGAAKTHDPATTDNAADASKSAAKTDPACNAAKAKDKSADAGAKASSSAKVGKDTGVIPTGRIKKSSDTACATQPQ